ncbi:MAG: glycosyltransferase family 39 protein [Acidobacteriota bacterium]|nr:glycosyltransferase family 39 protein [Acidobacteriota bacterium]
MTAPRPHRAWICSTGALAILLAICIARLWIMPMRSSLWVDEIVTTFVIRFPRHPSFSVAPQVPESIYYLLPRLSWDILGQSERALRLPTLLAMGAALFFIAKIAMRTIHPRAGWLAVFLCLTLHWFDYFAIDARMYGLGIAVSSASIYFLIRWFDGGRWVDAAAFALCGALLWRIHLLFWPFYLIYPIYAAARLRKREMRATFLQIALVAIFVTAALIPVVRTAQRILEGAPSHSFNPPPDLLTFIYMVHINVVAICAVVALMFRGYSRWPARIALPGGTWTLVFAWWLVCPLSIAAYSHLSGNGLLVSRYVSLMYPGIALTAAAFLVWLLPETWIRPVSVAVGILALALMGQWTRLRHPRHELSDWRTAAAVERIAAGPATPVLCPSPFIEAKEPVWKPGYPIQSFLYSQLSYYPLRGNLRPFPFERSELSDLYSTKLLASELVPARRFLIYGSLGGADYVARYLGSRPELQGWSSQVRAFGDVMIVEFDAGN